MFTPKRRKREYRANWLQTSQSDKKLLNFKCEKCGSTDRVQRHHIVSMNPNRRGRGFRGGGGADNLLNLMLLCYTCHLIQHGKLPRRH